MVRRIEPFKASHISMFRPQDAQAHEPAPDAAYTAIEAAGLSFTGFRDDTILACCGYIDMWPGRALCWTRIAFAATRHDMLWIHRQVAKFIEANPRRRLEMTVDAGFYAGFRWAELLGFDKEALLRAYDPSGRDHVGYCKVNHG